MPGDTFESDGLTIAYEELWPDENSDPDTIVLVHGFASNRRNNWAQQGWYDALTGAGWHVVAIDCRGHGASEKPTNSAAYAGTSMADDVLALTDHLELDTPALMGYSMGGYIGLHLLCRYPDRFSAVVLGGVGDSILEGLEMAESMARGLETDDPSSLEDPVASLFRAFADSLDNDLEALAACARTDQAAVDTAALDSITIPVLVVSGAADPLLGDPAALAAAIPGADLELIDGADHLTTVPHKRYRERTLAFLDEQVT